MYHIYLIRSQSCPDQKYVGFTTDLSARLEAHNAGQSPHTAKFRPWELIVAVQFADE